MSTSSLCDVQILELLGACTWLNVASDQERSMIRENNFTQYTVEQLSVVVSAIYSELTFHTGSIDDLPDLMGMVRRAKPVNHLDAHAKMALLDRLFELKLKKDECVKRDGRNLIEFVRKNALVSEVESLLSNLLINAFEGDEVDWLIFEWNHYNTAMVVESGDVAHIASLENFKNHMEIRSNHG